MATNAGPSTSKNPDDDFCSTENKTNKRKLDELLRRSERVQRNIFHKYFPEDPEELYKVLNKHREKIKKLRNDEKIYKGEFHLILPKSKKTISHKFDSPLIMKLLRYFVSNINVPTNGWDKMPEPNDQTEEAHIVRLVINRNEVQHTTGYVPEPEFKEVADSMIQSMIALGEDKQSFEDILPPIRYKILPPIKNFKFRQQYIKDIHNAVESNKKDKLWYVIHALAGTGKSEMVKKYAEEYRSHFNGNCVWINSSSKESLETAFIEIAESCRLQINDEKGNLQSINYITNRVHDHLRLDSVLYVFDDVCNDDEVRNFLPDYPSSVTLITSQLAEWPKPEFNVMELQMFNADESSEFVDENINQEHQDVVREETLKKVFTLLGGHPLALQQFIKAIANTSKERVNEFIITFISKVTKSLNLNVSLPPSKVSAITSININIERLRDSDDTELATSILDTAIYLDVTGISMEVIEMLFSGSDIVDITDAIHHLLSRSLLTKVNAPEGVQLFTIHSLIKEAVSMKHKEKQCTSDFIAKCNNTFKGALNSRLHHSNEKHWTEHFLYITTIDIEDVGLMSEIYDSVVCWLSQRRGKCLYLLKFLEKYATLMKEETFDEHNKFAALNNLATCYGNIGQNDKAISIHEDVVMKQSKVLGPDHPETLASLNNLANCYANIKENCKAILIHKDVVMKRSKVLGPDHPETLASLNNLAICYGNIGQNDKAISIHEDVAEKRSKVLGPDHPETLSSFNNLAICYGNIGQNDKAISIDEDVAEKRSKVLGPDHPETLSSLNNLANCYARIKENNKAISIHEDVAEKRSKVLGPDHPETLASFNNLAICYGNIGKNDKAISTDEDVAVKRSKVFDFVKIRTPNCVASPVVRIVTCDCAINVFNYKAISIHGDVTEKRSKVLGPDHPETLASLNNLAVCYGNIGQNDKAISMQEDVAEKL